MKAADVLREQGIKVGIILLEILTPYDRCAALVEKALTEGVKSVLFLEEEIRSGGMGMNLSDKLRGILAQRGIAYDILATDDDFVAVVEKGQSIYAAAGVDTEHICQKIKDITK
jgi:transketolase C-terminal domain/subunit